MFSHVMSALSLAFLQVVFPEQGRRSDFVEVRGPKDDVKRAVKMLREMNDDMIAENYTITVPVLQKFHRNIIGRGGANIRSVSCCCVVVNVGILLSCMGWSMGTSRLLLSGGHSVTVAHR